MRDDIRSKKEKFNREDRGKEQVKKKEWESRILKKVVKGCQGRWFAVGVSLFVFSLGIVSVAVGGGRVGKYPNPKGSSAGLIILEKDRAVANCIRDCMRRNQMQATAVEVIEANCRQECEFKRAVSLLQSDNPKNQITGVKKLRALKDKRAVRYLVRALEKEFGKRTGLWAWIIPALGDFKDPTAVPVLVKALEIEDDTWLGREKAVVALGEIGSSKAVSALVRAAEREETRMAAMVALGEVHDERAIPVFLSALYPEEEQEIRDAAMRGLRGLGSVAVPAMIKAFSAYSAEHPDTKRRVWLCRLLGESRDRRAEETLRKALKDPDEAVRGCAEAHIHGMTEE